MYVQWSLPLLGAITTRGVFGITCLFMAMLDNNGVPVARNIGLNTLRRMVDSIYNLKKDDMSNGLQQKRNIAGIQVLQGQQFCFWLV